MPRKKAKPEAPIPPIIPKPEESKAINLHLRLTVIEELDAIVAKMGGSRSDAFRWLLSLARPPKAKKQPKA